jgi:hypothetical protein
VNPVDSAIHPAESAAGGGPHVDGKIGGVVSLPVLGSPGRGDGELKPLT